MQANPCPFCGSVQPEPRPWSSLVFQDDDRWYSYGCMCGAQGPAVEPDEDEVGQDWDDTEAVRLSVLDKCVASWNRRPGNST